MGAVKRLYEYKYEISHSIKVEKNLLRNFVNTNIWMTTQRNVMLIIFDFTRWTYIVAGTQIIVRLSALVRLAFDMWFWLKPRIESVTYCALLAAVGAVWIFFFYLLMFVGADRSTRCSDTGCLPASSEYEITQFQQQFVADLGITNWNYMKVLLSGDFRSFYSSA